MVEQHHRLIDTQAKEAAKNETAGGMNQLHGLLVGKLQEEIDATSKQNAGKLASKKAAEVIHATQKKFEARLTASVHVDGRKDALAVANHIVEKTLSTKSGLAEAVAALAMSEMNKSVKKY